MIADTVTVGHEARQGDTAMSDHIRRKVWAELKRRYAQEHAIHFVTQMETYPETDDS